ncbi:MAG: hypothetical protein Q7R90_05055 [bacterium]|nr:hypothetical protein [bacterium]
MIKDSGMEGKGKIIDLGKKRHERGLPDVPENISGKTFEEYAEKVIREFEAEYDIEHKSVTSRVKTARNYGEDEMVTILADELRGKHNYNAVLVYAVAKRYKEFADEKRRMNPV